MNTNTRSVLDNRSKACFNDGMTTRLRPSLRSAPDDAPTCAFLGRHAWTTTGLDVTPDGVLVETRTCPSCDAHQQRPYGTHTWKDAS